MERYFYNTYGPDQEAEKHILRKAVELASNLNVNVITFYVHTFHNTGWTERLFGENSTKHLRQGYNHNGFTFNLHTHRTFEKHGNDCILVALGQDSDSLFELECTRRIKAIIALPWVEEECHAWAYSFGVHEISTNESFEKRSLPCVVEKALEQLTNSINISSGITHPMDERKAKTYIRALNKYGYEMDVSAVKAYLVENYWTKNGMSEVASLINTVNDGRYFQGGDKTGLQNYIKKWEAECEQ